MRTLEEQRALVVVTYFVVLGFKLGKGGLFIADEPKEIHGGEEQCRSAARRIKAERDGVVAFSRSGNPATGDWDDAVVIWQDGVVPDDVLAMAS